MILVQIQRKELGKFLLRPSQPENTGVIKSFTQKCILISILRKLVLG